MLDAESVDRADADEFRLGIADLQKLLFLLHSILCADTVVGFMAEQTPDEGAAMVLSTNPAGRAVAAGIGIGAIASAMLCGSAATAAADPPNCTAADLARVSSQVSAATSDYLFAHPDVNTFFTGLKGQPRSEIADDVQNYLNANPQTQAELQGIRQPLIDFKNGCGVPTSNTFSPEPTPLAPAPAG